MTAITPLINNVNEFENNKNNINEAASNEIQTTLTIEIIHVVYLLFEAATIVLPFPLRVSKNERERMRKKNLFHKTRYCLSTRKFWIEKKSMRELNIKKWNEAKTITGLKYFTWFFDICNSIFSYDVGFVHMWMVCQCVCVWYKCFCLYMFVHFRNRFHFNCK